MATLDGAIKAIVILLAITGLCACTEKFAAETPASVKAAQTTKMAKTGAAIKLVSDSLISILPNQPTQATIVLANMDSQSDISVQFSPSPGLILGDTAVHQVIQNVQATSVKIPITLIAINSGRYYLNMHISVNNTEATAVRNLAVIVQVGSVVKHVPQLKKTAGENIIVLPAQETISTP